MKENKTQNVAFFDAEFTARTEKDRGIQEMIQCAFIVCPIEFSSSGEFLSLIENPIFSYSTFVKPTYTKQLSDYIKELTGIRQEDVDGGKTFHEALEDIYNTIKQYNIQKIITWGPDRLLLKNNCSISAYNASKAKDVCGKFYDVSRKLSYICGYDHLISQHKMCEIFGITEIGDRHDAYSDAVNLSKVVKEFFGKEIPLKTII